VGVVMQQEKEIIKDTCMEENFSQSLFTEQFHLTNTNKLSFPANSITFQVETIEVLKTGQWHTSKIQKAAHHIFVYVNEVAGRADSL
jgi:hypothetical protein